MHYPHPYNPKNKTTIIRKWVETRTTKCPINSPHNVNKLYEGTFIEYTFIDKNKSKKYVEEYCLHIRWL